VSGDVVNLRLARKRKAREEAEAAATANRTKFGRSKQEKQLTGAIREIETQRIEGKRLERSEKSDEPQ
jgi:hypothetical protein